MASDDEWHLPPEPKQKPKNWAMLKGKKKEGKIKRAIIEAMSEMS